MEGRDAESAGRNRLGVRERGDLVYWDTYPEVGYEIYESLDPETTPPDYDMRSFRLNPEW
jgi:hypothetical protein